MPQVSGIDSLNTTILNSVIAFSGKYSGAYVDPDIAFGDSLIVTYVATDAPDSDRYAKLEVTISTALNAASAERATYYIDKDEKTTLASEDAYNDALKAEADEKAAAEEEEEEEEVVEEPVEEEFELTDEALDDLVPLVAHLETLGITRDDIEWNGTVKSVTINGGEIILVVGLDEYVVGDETVVLGVAPTIIDDYTYVPVRFFIEILGADYVVDDGIIVGFEWSADDAE
jgi:hypothetical protein